MKELGDNVDRFAGLVGMAQACLAFGINQRTHRYRRQKQQGRLKEAKRDSSKKPFVHPAALSTKEREDIIKALCSPRFCDMAPAQVYMTLLDEKTYLCSERQMYRVLADAGLVGERRRGGHQRRASYGVPRLVATKPRQVWTWDIERHEALLNRVEMKGLHQRAVAAAQ